MLSINVRLETTRMSNNDWHEMTARFADVSIYQSAEYGAQSWGLNNLEHAILYKEEKPVSVCQIRLQRFPLGLGGIAYTRWGPLWKAIDGAADVDHLRLMIRALQEEYARKRGFTLVLLPRVFTDHAESEAVEKTFDDCGFTLKGLPQRTAHFPLTAPLQDIRSSIDRRWRQYLKKAEQAELRVDIGSDPALFQTGVGIYKEMVARKCFDEFIDISLFDRINRQLPENKRLKTVVCYDGEQPAAFLTASIWGDTAVALFAGTADIGLQSYASFLVWWEMIKVLKESGCAWLDIGGINKARNPGLYQFKSKLYKKTGHECDILGQFWHHGSLLSRLGSVSARGYKMYSMRLRWALEKVRMRTAKA